MNLKDILKGTRIYHEGVQSIAGLTILPLVCDRELSFDDKYASPFAHNVSNTNYGNLTIHRGPAAQDKELLVMGNTIYVTSYAAQDHLMSKAALLKKQSSQKTFNDARCIQPRQGGTIRSTGDNKVYIAPMKIREAAYNYVGENNYSKIWPDIAKFNQSSGVTGRDADQLQEYFKVWDSELDKFIAHFERLDNCIGIITLFNDEVVAVDKFPSFTYTAEIWEKLVRDSYASLVIQARVNKVEPKGETKKVNDVKRALSLEAIYKQLVDSRRDHYTTLLKEMMEVEFTTKTDADTPGSKILNSEGYVGQVIEDNGVNVMVSIVKKDSFKPESMRKAREMKAIASRQKGFEV